MVQSRGVRQALPTLVNAASFWRSLIDRARPYRCSPTVRVRLRPARVSTDRWPWKT